MPLLATYNAARQHGAWYRIESFSAKGQPRICGNQQLTHAYLTQSVRADFFDKPLPLASLVQGARVVVAWRQPGADEDTFWEAVVVRAPSIDPAETLRARAFAAADEHDPNSVFYGAPVKTAPAGVRTVRVRWMHDSDDSTVDVNRVYASIGSASIEDAWRRGPGNNPAYWIM